jgi:hypothetical protein
MTVEHDGAGAGVTLPLPAIIENQLARAPR